MDFLLNFSYMAIPIIKYVWGNTEAPFAAAIAAVLTRLAGH
jgi:hypothetical protein